MVENNHFGFLHNENTVRDVTNDSELYRANFYAMRRFQANKNLRLQRFNDSTLSSSASAAVRSIYNYPIFLCDYSNKVWCEVMKKLSFKSLLRLQRICKKILSMVQNDSLWEWKLKHDYKLESSMSGISCFMTYRFFTWCDHLADIFPIVGADVATNEKCYLRGFLHSREPPYASIKYLSKAKMKIIFGLIEDEIRSDYKLLMEPYLSHFNCGPNTSSQSLAHKIYERTSLYGYKYLLEPLRESVRYIAYIDYPEVMDMLSYYNTIGDYNYDYRWTFLHDILVKKLLQSEKNLSNYTLERCLRNRIQVEEAYMYYFHISVFIRKVFGKIALIRYPQHQNFNPPLSEENMAIYSYYKMAYELKSGIQMDNTVVTVAGDKYNHIKIFQLCLDFMVIESSGLPNLPQTNLLRSFCGLKGIGYKYFTRFSAVLHLILKLSDVKDDSLTDIVLNHPQCREYLFSGSLKCFNTLSHFVITFKNLYIWFIRANSENQCTNPFYLFLCKVPIRKFIQDICKWHVEIGEVYLPLEKLLENKVDANSIHKFKMYIVYKYCKINVADTLRKCATSLNFNEPLIHPNVQADPGKRPCSCPFNVYCVHKYYLNFWSHYDENQ